MTICRRWAPLVLLPGVLMAQERVQLRLDCSEAEAVLQIVEQRAAGHEPQAADWARLYALEPYQRLKQRETAMAVQTGDVTRNLTDAQFQSFVLSPGLAERAPALRAALGRWRAADLQAAAHGVLPYLPAAAAIRAKVYIMIKPKGNSFVWDLDRDPAIFLYLDPAVSAAKFANTVAHELHHIGLGSLGPVYEKRIEAWPERERTAAGWMGAFGEGLAMLAAAGSADADPHAASAPTERARWNADLANFDRDLPLVDAFFTAILKGEAGDAAAVTKRASEFYGIQGPWYTVGYRMAVLVEQRFGRAALVETMLNPPCLLALYNRAAAEHNARPVSARWPLWSADVLAAARAGSCAAPAKP
jgi:hypothetical protein